MAEPAVYQEAIERFSDWRWRLDNLYWITDKDGRRVKFQLNWAQESLFNQMHFMNVILKARQLGFTTFIQIFMLDACLFNSNVRAGTVAHKLDEAKTIFRDKVKYPYDNLPEQLKACLSVTKDAADELMFSNNSSIRVGSSLRSGTLQYLHVSEYGKLCAQYPEKAREVRTGALNTIQAGQIVFIESTAEGQDGHFFDICQAAQVKARMANKLTTLDFKFHFFPWWKSPEYVLDPEGVVIGEDYERYFGKLAETHGVVLTPGQKAWYVKKAETQQEDMKREYPGTPAEAFEASVEGAYYGQQMAKAELQGRIGAFPIDLKYPVFTAWDIGYHDETAIWFFQILPGVVRLIGYYENNGEGMPHYIAELERRRDEHGFDEIDGKRIYRMRYGTHYLPHDIRVHEWTNGLARIEQMLAEIKRRSLGKLEKVPDHNVEDGINAVRQMLGICQFDEAACAVGIKALRNYRKDWDEEHGIWRDRPRHDWASHGADAKRSLAMVYRDLKPEPPPLPPPRGTLDMTMDEAWKLTRPQKADARI